MVVLTGYKCHTTGDTVEMGHAIKLYNGPRTLPPHVQPNS
jgi:hypothetical protein